MWMSAQQFLIYVETDVVSIQWALIVVYAIKGIKSTRVANIVLVSFISLLPAGGFSHFIPPFVLFYRFRLSLLLFFIAEEKT